MGDPTNGSGPATGGPVADGPIGDLASLPLVSDAVAAAIKAAAGILTAPAAPAPSVPTPAALLATKPGVERWPVKTGQDADRDLVGRNVIGGVDLGAGLVPTTVEEMISAPRPADMSDVANLNPAYQSRRAAPVETVVWRMDVTIIAMKLETDGDYHLVLQGASGETMIGEIPTPDPAFVGDCPWLADIAAARQAVDAKFVSQLPAARFTPLAGKLVPLASLIAPSRDAPPPPASFLPVPGAAAPPAFKTQLPPTLARITGVGFFDKVHGQMGVSQSNGIELHPVVNIEWL